MLTISVYLVWSTTLLVRTLAVPSRHDGHGRRVCWLLLPDPRDVETTWHLGQPPFNTAV